MNDHTLNKRALTNSLLLLACIFSMLAVSSFSVKNIPVAKPGRLKISFINTANGKPVVLRDSSYSNHFGETYYINKLKYYISNITLQTATDGKLYYKDGYHLVNAASETNSFEFDMAPGSYSSIRFLLGVDSAKNCSGAQSGALDPLNDMFWTWNSGYVMFKLEGTSPASAADLNRIEHHLGGYKGLYNVVTPIELSLYNSRMLEIKENSTTEIVIEANMDNYWKGDRDIRISEVPVCITTGEIAKKISSNFKYLFTVRTIQNIP